MTAKKPNNWSKARQTRVDQLFEAAMYCPLCGGGLERLGSRDSIFKTRPDKHGVVFAQGNRRDLRMGIVMEVEDE